MRKKLFELKIVYYSVLLILMVGLIQCTQKTEGPIKDNTPQIIVSKIEGGDWSDVATWQQGVVPTIDSDVNITGKVNVKGKAECLNLLVDNGATLEISPNSVLTVKHHVINDGTIINNGEIKVRDKTHK